MTWLQSCRIQDGENSAQMADSVGVGANPNTCPVCGAAGRMSKLRLFQINLSEAAMLCSVKECTYPLGILPSAKILVKRDAADVTFAKKRKATHIPLASLPRKVTRKSKPTPAVDFRQSRVSVTPGSHPNQVPPVESATALVQQLKQNLFKKPSVKFSGFQSFVAEHRKQTAIIDDILKDDVPGNTTSSAVEHESVTGVKKSNSCLVPGRGVYPQWANSNMSCWLDAVMCLLVHSKHLQIKATINHLASNILDVVKSYKVARVLCSRVTSSRLMTITKVNKSLESVRGQAWEVIQTRLKCEQGKANSASCGLMALLYSEPIPIQKLCTIRYNLTGRCDKCNNHQNDSLEKRVITFGDLPLDFNMAKPHQLRDCERCHTGSVDIAIDIKSYPPVLFCQFVCGLPGKQLADYDFTLPNGSVYRVQSVIQYKRNPDHFVTWVRDIICKCSGGMFLKLKFSKFSFDK